MLNLTVSKKRPYTDVDSKAFMIRLRAEVDAYIDEWLRIMAGDKEALKARQIRLRNQNLTIPASKVR